LASLHKEPISIEEGGFSEIEAPRSNQKLAVTNQKIPSMMHLV